MDSSEYIHNLTSMSGDIGRFSLDIRLLNPLPPDIIIRTFTPLLFNLLLICT